MILTSFDLYTFGVFMIHFFVQPDIPRGYRKVIREKAGQVFISIIFDRVYPLPVCTALLGVSDTSRFLIIL